MEHIGRNGRFTEKHFERDQVTRPGFLKQPRITFEIIVFAAHVHGDRSAGTLLIGNSRLTTFKLATKSACSPRSISKTV